MLPVASLVLLIAGGPGSWSSPTAMDIEPLGVKEQSQSFVTPPLCTVGDNVREHCTRRAQDSEPGFLWNTIKVTHWLGSFYHVYCLISILIIYSCSFKSCIDTWNKPDD